MILQRPLNASLLFILLNASLGVAAPYQKEFYMLKKGVFALCAIAAVGCSNGAPSEEQVKQALYTHYATAQGGADLQQSLNKGIGVNDCRKSGEEYRCLIENKALGTAIPMYFAYDKAEEKWKFTKEETNQ